MKIIIIELLHFVKLGNVSRAAYYKWLHRDIPKSEQKNRFIADEIEKIHTDSPDKGYRRIRDDLERYHGIDVNDKRVLRICRKLNIKSTIKYSNNGCTRQAANPQYIAENILNREFTAKAPNEKWLTDVTEFHYYIGIEKRKVYLSAILDCMIGELFHMLFAIITTTHWYLIPLTKPYEEIRMLILCFIQTGDSNILIGHFIQNL